MIASGAGDDSIKIFGEEKDNIGIQIRLLFRTRSRKNRKSVCRPNVCFLLEQEMGEIAKCNFFVFYLFDSYSEASTLKEEGALSYELLLTVPHAHTADINCVSWAPQGNILASCADDGTVKLWEWVE